MIIKKQVYKADKKANPFIGVLLFFISIVLLLLTGPIGFIYGVFYQLFGITILCVLLWIILPFLFPGLRSVRPNEALVLTLFGKYYGTLSGAGRKRRSSA